MLALTPVGVGSDWHEVGELNGEPIVVVLGAGADNVAADEDV